jgi:hypothetical protein
LYVSHQGLAGGLPEFHTQLLPVVSQGYYCIAGIDPGYIRLPQSENNIVQLMGVLLACEKNQKFLAVCWVSVL